MHISDEVKQSAIRRASADATARLGPYKILRKENMDGIKFFLDVPESDPKRLSRGAVTGLRDELLLGSMPKGRLRGLWGDPGCCRKLRAAPITRGH